MSRIALALVIACAACGSKSGESTPTTTPAAEESPPAPEAAGPAEAVTPEAAPPATVNFKALDHEAKAEFMKTKVLPPMTAAFQTFDAKKYAAFDCKTCHGKDPVKSKFVMPNPELPKLDFEALQAGKGDPKILEFMSKTVSPEMAKILGQEPYSESNPKGFGCLNCHTQKPAKPAKKTK